MYSTSDIKKNLKIKMDNQPWTVVEFQFVKPGKGTAFTRTKMKNLISGQVIERNFRSGEVLEPAELEHLEATLVYKEAESWHFMNSATYEQFAVPLDSLGDAAKWIADEMPVQMLIYEGRAVSVEVPNHIELEIIECEPAVKGDTATNATKPAIVSTGATVQVPLFMKEGEVIKIDTRTATYGGRVK